MTEPSNPYGSNPYGAPPPGYGTPAGYGAPPPGYQPHTGYGQPPAPGQAPFGLQLASPWLRLGAVLLNGVLLIVTLGIGYLVWCMVLWQQGTNPGKKMLGMKIVSAESGQTLDWGGMFVRNFVFGGLVLGVLQIVTLGIFFLIDALTIFGDKNQRMVVDKWPKTHVVMA